MKTLTDAALRLAPLALAALFVVAPPAQDGMSLHDAMENLKDQLKGLAGALEGGDQAASLNHVAMMQSLILLGKEQEPSNLYDQPEDQRADHTLAFRSEMAKTLAALAEMEVQICDGDFEGAIGAIRSSLLPLRNDSHDRFQPEDH
jgi:hypothetical protein